MKYFISTQTKFVNSLATFILHGDLQFYFIFLFCSYFFLNAMSNLRVIHINKKRKKSHVQEQLNKDKNWEDLPWKMVNWVVFPLSGPKWVPLTACLAAMNWPPPPVGCSIDKGLSCWAQSPWTDWDPKAVPNQWPVGIEENCPMVLGISPSCSLKYIVCIAILSLPKGSIPQFLNFSF